MRTKPRGSVCSRNSRGNLRSRKCHQTLFAAVCIVLPAERYFAVSEANQPVVGDGDSVRVAGEAVENMQRSAEGRLGIGDGLDR